jgi:hypothetical protein
VRVGFLAVAANFSIILVSHFQHREIFRHGDTEPQKKSETDIWIFAFMPVWVRSEFLSQVLRSAAFRATDDRFTFLPRSAR